MARAALLVVCLVSAASVIAGCAAPSKPEPVSSAPIGETSVSGSPSPASFEDLAWEARIDAAFADIECPEPRPHEHAYKGPLIDSHFHIQSLPDSTPRPGEPDDHGDPATRNALLGVDITFDELACVFQYDGTAKAIAFFATYPNIQDHALEAAHRAIEKHPDLFFPFIMPPDSDDRPDGSPTVDATRLRQMLAVHPDLFEGYGEIGLYARLGGSAELPPDSPRLMEIYPVVREHGLAVYFHLGEGHKESWERVLAANPDIHFIWHGDQLTVQDVEDVLSRHPNVSYSVDELYGDVWLLRNGVTKEEFFAHFEDYEPLLEKDLATWKGPIERHPDQFMWSTDRGVTIWTNDRDVGWQLNDYGRAFISRLDPSVQERFAHENAERIFDGMAG